MIRRPWQLEYRQSPNTGGYRRKDGIERVSYTTWERAMEIALWAAERGATDIKVRRRIPVES